MESIEFRNNVPAVERLLVAFFVLVGAPMLWLVWSRPDEIPGWAVTVFGLGFPAILVGYAWRVFDRRRTRTVLPAGDRQALIVERRRWRWVRRRVSPVDVRLDIGEDIDGDPYGRLDLVLADGCEVTVLEGTDIEDLRVALERVRTWMSRAGS